MVKMKKSEKTMLKNLNLPNLHPDEVGEKDSVGVVRLFSGSAPMRPSVLRSNPHVLRFCLKIPEIHLIKYPIALKR